MSWAGSGQTAAPRSYLGLTCALEPTSAVTRLEFSSRAAISKAATCSNDCGSHLARLGGLFDAATGGADRPAGRPTCGDGLTVRPNFAERSAIAKGPPHTGHSTLRRLRLGAAASTRWVAAERPSRGSRTIIRKIRGQLTPGGDSRPGICPVSGAVRTEWHAGLIIRLSLGPMDRTGVDDLRSRPLGSPSFQPRLFGRFACPHRGDDREVSHPPLQPRSRHHGRRRHWPVTITPYRWRRGSRQEIWGVSGPV